MSKRINRNIMEFKEQCRRRVLNENGRINRNIMEFKAVYMGQQTGRKLELIET